MTKAMKRDDDGREELRRRRTSGYDISYRDTGMDIEPHFCRCWDEDEGCYGTNPEHGYTWAEAVQQIAWQLRERAAWWEARTEAEHFPSVDEDDADAAIPEAPPHG